MIKRKKSPHPPFTKGGQGGINSKAGFTLIELLITMFIFVLVIAASSQIFTGLLTQFKQQSKIAETNIEGIVGLAILKQDIGHAGYGLPWNLGGAAYQEAVVESVTPWVDRDFNDGPPDNPARGTDPAGASNPPGGIRSGNGYALNGSDVFVIKAINVARNDASQRWTSLRSTAPFVKTWTPARENLAGTYRVIILSPGSTDLNSRTLVVSGVAFSTTYSSVTAAPWVPTDFTDTRLVYGVDPDTNLRMPFNRADYYVRRPAAAEVPQRCAGNTGILYKATVNHSNGRLNELPLFDCVADMQVVYRRDTDDDGTIDNTTDDISTLTAQQIRDQVKEVRVYILAHEGQRDVNYTYAPTTIYVGDPAIGGGRNFNIGTNVNYRWKLYTLVVKPNNLR
jgi:prepilin-type N-terminal cleavage/methylation domain-containing protein